MTDDIKPDHEYSSVMLIEYEDRGPVNAWALEQANMLSGDLVAGVLSALDEIHDDLETNFAYNKRLEVSIHNEEDIEIYLHEQHASQSLSYHFSHKVNLLDLTLTAGLMPGPKLGFFGWWLKSFVRTATIYLYVFRTPEFIQGFISTCNAAQVDFRKYALGPPFKLEGNRPIYYEIRGYPIPPIPDIIERRLRYYQ